MPEYTQTLVSSLEYEALVNLDKMVRLAISVPGTGEFLVTAIQALDQVRIDQDLPIPEAVAPREKPTEHKKAEVSQLAASPIRRAMDGAK